MPWCGTWFTVTCVLRDDVRMLICVTERCCGWMRTQMKVVNLYIINDIGAQCSWTHKSWLRILYWRLWRCVFPIELPLAVETTCQVVEWIAARVSWNTIWNPCFQTGNILLWLKHCFRRDEAASRPRTQYFARRMTSSRSTGSDKSGGFDSNFDISDRQKSSVSASSSSLGVSNSSGCE